MKAEKPNKGFLKEIKKPAAVSEKKKPFTYSKPVVKVEHVNSMGLTSRSKNFKSAKQDKTTNFKIEQTNAKASHKGSK